MKFFPAFGSASGNLFSRTGMMLILGDYDCVACPTDCTTPSEFPTTLINECPDAIDLVESEICTIYVSDIDANGEATAKPATITDAAAWATVLGNGAGTLRKLNVIGDMPLATKNQVKISKRRTKNGRKSFVVNADIDEFNATNYEMARNLECGYVGRIWIEIYGGYIFGGADGIKAELADINIPFGRGENVYAVIPTVWQWDAKCHPPMTVSPFAA